MARAVREERGVGRLFPLAGGPHVGVAGCEHQPLDLTGGVRRVAGDPPGELHGRGERGSLRAHLEGEPRRHHLFGVDPLGGEQQGGGPLPPDPGGQQHAARGLRGNTELREGDPEPRSLLDEDEVHVQEQSAPEADPDPVHRGEEWLVEPAQHVEQAAEARTCALPECARGDRGHLAEILPGAECGPAPGEDHRPDRVVLERARERAGDGVVHRGVEGVPRLGPVERDQPHAVSVLDHDPVLAHARKTCPPSTLNTCPVIHEASSERRNWHSPTRSEG